MTEETLVSRLEKAIEELQQIRSTITGTPNVMRQGSGRRPTKVNSVASMNGTPTPNRKASREVSSTTRRKIGQAVRRAWSLKRKAAKKTTVKTM
jgi:hypothetical protein